MNFGFRSLEEPKTIPIIMLIDNRIRCSQKERSYECQQFRCSGFKQTQVDASQHQIQRLREDQDLFYDLMSRVSNLEERIQKLEKNSLSEKDCQKKYRRKAKDIVRDFKCPHSQCQKVYGSETSLRSHIKIKHSCRSN